MMRFSTHRPGFGSTSALSVGSSSSASSSSVPHRVRRHDLLPAAPHFSERLPKFWLKSLIYTKIGCPRKLWSVCWRQGLPNKKKTINQGVTRESRQVHGCAVIKLIEPQVPPLFRFWTFHKWGYPFSSSIFVWDSPWNKPSSDKEEWRGMMISPGHRKKMRSSLA